MKKLIATVLTLVQLGIGSSVLYASSEGVKENRVDKKNEAVVDHVAVDANKQKELVEKINQLIKEIMTASCIKKDFEPYKAQSQYQNSVSLGLNKELNTENGVRGASANLLLDKHRKLQSFNVDFKYNGTGVRINYDFKTNNSLVGLSYNDEKNRHGLEVILSNTQSPYLNAHVTLGGLVRVSGAYDTNTKNMVTNLSTNYKGASVNVSWAPKQDLINFTAAYAIPENLHIPVNNVSWTSTRIRNTEMNRFSLSSGKGAVKVVASLDNFNPALNYKPCISMICNWKF